MHPGRRVAGGPPPSPTRPAPSPEYAKARFRQAAMAGGQGWQAQSFSVGTAGGGAGSFAAPPSAALWSSAVTLPRVVHLAGPADKGLRGAAEDRGYTGVWEQLKREVEMIGNV